MGFFYVIVLADEQMFRLICQGKRLDDSFVGRPIFLSQSVHYCPLMSTTNGHDYGISKANYERSVHLSTSFLYKRGFKKYIYTTIKELFLWTSGQNSEKGLCSKVIYVQYKWTQVDTSGQSGQLFLSLDVSKGCVHPSSSSCTTP